jgi:NO-binding membrane sensor protein with MHYT domain
MVLALSGQSLGYAVGYRPVIAVALWVGAVVLAALVLAPVAWKPRPLAAFGCGLVFGVGVALLQIGLVVAVDAEPGVVWDGAGLAFAPLVAAAGGTGALWIVFLGAGRRGKRRRAWRWAAAGLAALAVVVAQDTEDTTAALAGQADSLARRGGIPASAAAAVAGLAVPMLLVAGLADLWLRREGRRKPQRTTARERRGRSAETAGGWRR